jgi:hypothetical protein
MCKNLGNTRVKVKVLLDLQPAELPAQQLLANPVAHWQVSGPLAALPAPAGTLAAAAAATAAAAAAAEAAAPGAVVAAAAACAAESVDASEAAVTEGTSAASATAVNEGAAALVGSSAVGDDTEPDLAAAVAAAELLQQLQQEPHGQQADEELYSSDTAAAASVVAAADGLAQHGAGTPDSLDPVQHAFAAAADEGGEAMQPVHKRSSSRLRAEVSHASAPAATRSSSPAADTQQRRGQDNQQQQQEANLGLHSKLMPIALLEEQPQQQQQVVLYQAEQQQQQPLELPVALADVRVCVEGALNLQLPPLADGEDRGAVCCCCIIPKCCGSDILLPSQVLHCPCLHDASQRHACSE